MGYKMGYKMQGGAQWSSIQNPGWLMINVYYRWLMVVIPCTTQYKII